MQRARASLKIMLLVILCLGVLAAALFLPPVLADLENKALTKDIHVTSAEDARFVSKEEMSVIEKLHLLESAEESDFLFIETGEAMDATTMRTAAEKGVGSLIDRNILPKGELGWSEETKQTQVFFVLRPDKPSQNMIVWFQPFTLGELSGVLCIDDETGLVLQCLIWGESTSEAFVLPPQQDWLAAWGSYLGIAYQEGAVLEGEEWSRTFEHNEKSVVVSSMRGPDHATFGFNAYLYRYTLMTSVTTMQ